MYGITKIHKVIAFYLSGSALLLTGCAENKNVNIDDMAPVAKKIKKELTIHGSTRIDNYYWLNQREDQKVLDYLNAENDYTTKKLKHTEELQKNLFDEIIGRIKKTDVSVPYKEGSYYYYTRYAEGNEYPVHSREQAKEGVDMIQAILADMESGTKREAEEILLDVNEMAKGSDYYDVTGLEVSPDETILAYGVDNVSRREYTIHFKNLTTGKLYDESIPKTAGGVTWASDNKTVFYTIKDETLREYKILKHVLGTSPADDVEVFHETDETYSTFVYKTKSKKYIVIGSYATLSSEYRILEADNPDGEFRVFHPREEKLEYSISHYKDKFYVKTNDDALNFKLMQTDVNETGKEHWEEVIAHREDVLIEGVEIFEDYLVIEERNKGLINIRVIRWDTKEEYYLEFPEDTYTAYVGYNPDYNTNMMRYGYTSLTTPSSSLMFNMTTKESVVLKEQEIIGDFDKSNYTAERLYAKATDGTMVPISLVYRKGLNKNGDNPTVLYGYGSYGASMDVYFSSARLSLLDRGFIWAIAHIRGGEDLGRQWYEDGKLLKKKNTFTDFISCGEHLIAEKYTSTDKLFAMGGSAGGLLMGAVVNMRPDLFKGIVAAVPFVDVVTTMLDETIPLTTGEYDEWGNPNEKEYYDYILSYSPYDNVEAKDYPAMLVTTGLHDSQVQYYEPAKWVAKLRDMKTDDNLLLLHTNMDAGHGGQSGRFRQFKETALEFSFMLDLVGITE